MRPPEHSERDPALAGQSCPWCWLPRPGEVIEKAAPQGESETLLQVQRSSPPESGLGKSLPAKLDQSELGERLGPGWFGIHQGWFSISHPSPSRLEAHGESVRLWLQLPTLVIPQHLLSMPKLLL